MTAFDSLVNFISSSPTVLKLFMSKQLHFMFYVSLDRLAFWSITSLVLTLSVRIHLIIYELNNLNRELFKMNIVRKSIEEFVYFMNRYLRHCPFRYAIMCASTDNHWSIMFKFDASSSTKTHFIRRWSSSTTVKSIRCYCNRWWSCGMRSCCSSCTMRCTIVVTHTQDRYDRTNVV